MVDTETYDYTAPVDQLLTYGEPEVVDPKDWPNYLELGFTSEHVPELIRLAIDERWKDDDRESIASWAPYHAWRTLGQLRAEAAVQPLLLLYKKQAENEWVMDELPEVYAMFGPVALPALTDFIADRTLHEWSRVTATSAIERIGLAFPDARAASVEILSKQLEMFAAAEDEFNAALIEALIKLEAKEAAPVIERVFAAGAVDEDIVGDWGDIQEALGLLSPEELADLHRRKEEERQARMKAFDMAMKSDTWLGPGAMSAGATPSDAYWRQTPRVSSPKKAKHKNKISKQSRKKNRKR